MPKITHSYKIAAVFLSLLAFASCNKNSTSPSSNRIARIDYRLQQPGQADKVNYYTLGYNADGKVSAVSQTNSDTFNQASFQYTTAIVNTRNYSIVRSNPGNGASVLGAALGLVYTRYDSLVLDSTNARITAIYDLRTFFNGTPDQQTSQVFTYDDMGQLKNSQTNGINTIMPFNISFPVFTYTNGDLTSVAASEGTVYYQYYQDKSFQQGDYNQLMSTLAVGRTIYNTKHLVKSFQYGGKTTNITYQTDSTSNRISKVTANDGFQTETWSLQYGYY